MLYACTGDDTASAPAVACRDSLPVMHTQGVSTTITDGGVVKYKIIAEDWFVYDKKTTSYWAFEKGLFLETFDRNVAPDAFISCDTAYYYDQQSLWELRGNVLAKNVEGETFTTTILFYNHGEQRFYSSEYMEINGIDERLSGYDFSSNQSLTNYSIHRSKGRIPFEEESDEAEN